MIEYPDSHWSTLAETQFELVDWLMRNQPRQFLDDLQRDLSQKDERIDRSDAAAPRAGGQESESGPGQQVEGATNGAPTDGSKVTRTGNPRQSESRVAVGKGDSE
jgi:hypothetical protein